MIKGMGLTLAALCAASLAYGSGSYVPRGPMPSAARLQEADRYERGKAIFNGKASLAAPSPERREKQADRLTRLEQQIPARGRPAAGLRALAGRLSDDQLASLEHYVRVRYNAK